MRILTLILALSTAAAVLISFAPLHQKKKQVESGKQLFNKMCANCHKSTTSGIGPPFQRIREVRGQAWVYRFMKNPAAMASSDNQVKATVKKYKLIMPSYKLTDAQVDAIMDYVDSFPYNASSKHYEHRKVK